MKRLLALAAVAAVLFAPAFALADPLGAVTPGSAGTQSDLAGCYRPSSTPAPAAGQQMALSCDANGNLLIGTGSGATAQQVQGNVASGATDSGNPVKIGCKYNATLPTYADGQRSDCQTTTKGGTIASIYTATGFSVDFGSGADGSGNTLAGLLAYSRDSVFNGTSWDRAFTCPNTAVVNVTAAATTQIVALASSQVIRVCSVMLSMSAAGTMKFVQGTGSNCGTGTADINTAMNLATATPLAFSAPTGGSILRTSASNALCIAAVTGNVVGMITYAQF